MAKTNNATGSAPNGAQLATFVQEEDLDDFGELHKQVQELAHKAREDGRIYLLTQYTRLLAVIEPEIERVQRRFKRENLAYLRREAGRLKDEKKNATVGQENASEPA
jgi:hypothetical protein